MAAQDEFFRSECYPHPSPHLPTRLLLPRLLALPIPGALDTSREPHTLESASVSPAVNSLRASTPLTGPLSFYQVAGR